MIDKVSPVSFNGLKVEGVISAKNMRKFSEFATAEENVELITDLERTFNTNMVINSKLSEISFSHEVYGNLSEFGCPKFPTTGFYSKVVDARNGIKQAIKKAEKFYEHHKQEYEKMRRGC